jgi:hypothetical protein
MTLIASGAFVLARDLISLSTPAGAAAVSVTTLNGARSASFASTR